MNEKKCDKLVFAVLQGDDYSEVVYALNQEGISVTMLNSTGGFLKRKSVTVMIGVEHDRLNELDGNLQKKGGAARRAGLFRRCPSGTRWSLPDDPHWRRAGKMRRRPVVFVTDLERMERY